MISKSILSLILFLITVFITYTITTTGVLNSGQFPHLKSTSSPSPSPPLPCHTLTPLKIYMYNLPTKFNIGLMKKNKKFTENNDTLFSVNVSNVPAWPDYAGLHLQHSVEYWMMTSLLVVNGSWEGREVVRVWDGESADVYFVPFFSSLSFNTFGKNMTDPDNEFDRQLQVDMLKFLRKSIYWQRSAGRDHVIPMHHPNAFRFLRDEVNASILIVADFGRYSKTMANLRKDVVAPYMHVVKSFIDDNPPDPFKLRTTLLFFRGRTVRKSEGKVRRQLEKILKGVKDVHFEASFATGEGINASTQGMRSSKFCLHPAGDTPSSNRLFDAIVSHCVPVIISDHIELPFESELDYTEFSLFFSIKEALIPGNIVEHLRKIPEKKWLKMWKRLKEITHHYEYQFPPKKDDAVNMIWRQVRTKVPAEKLAVNRIRRLKIPDWW